MPTVIESKILVYKCFSNLSHTEQSKKQLLEHILESIEVCQDTPKLVSELQLVGFEK